MNLKTAAIVLGALCAVSFAVGRYTAPEKVKTEIKIQKEVITQQVVHTVTKVVERPDGTKETEVTQDSDTNTHSDTVKDKLKEVIVSHDSLNISILAGAQPHLFQGISVGPIIYGASVTKTLWGPVTIGAWGLSDLSAGVSLGLNF